MTDLGLRAWSQSADPAGFGDVFAELPGRVRRDPYRAALLPAARWRAFLDVPVTREFWIAERDGRAVGRAGASLSPSHGATGYLGFFEVDVEDAGRAAVAAALIDAGSAWLRGRGVNTVYGPVDLATWFTYRFRVPTEDSADEEAEPPFAWEPVNPPEYVLWFLEAGFTEADRYHSIAFRADDPALVDLVAAATRVVHDEARDKGFAFRPLDAARLDAEALLLYTLSMDAFRDNFLFEPIPADVFRALYAAAGGGGERFVYFVLDPHGREVGFVLAFVDRGYTVVKTIAVRPDSRGQRLSTALMHLVFGAMAARGLRQVISALVKTGNTSEFLGARHQSLRAWRHDYALFEKSL